MENPAWARMVIVGLILAGLAVGYFLLSGGFVKSKPKTQVSQSVISTTPTVSASSGLAMAVSPTPTKSGPTPTLSGPTPTPSPQSAYNTIVNRNQNQNQNQYQNGTQGTTQTGSQTLPRTGFPLDLAVVFSVSAAISGWGLRKYPH